MKITIDRFTVIALCVTAITGVAIDKLDLIRLAIAHIF